jgi:hypothetical protein
MRAVLAIAGREVFEHRRVYLAAVVVGLLPPLMPWVMPSQDPGEVRGMFVLFNLIVFMLGAGLLGAASVGADLASGRIGFFFARPVSGLAIWAGKLLGILAFGVLSFPIIVLPTAVLGGAIAGYQWAPLALIAGITFVLVVLASHAAGIATRSRSAWLLLDVVAPAVLGYILYQAQRGLRAGEATEPGVLPVLIALGAVPLLGVIAGGALAVVAGRTDIRRAHRALSLTLWSATALAVLGFAGWMAWSAAAGPGDLVVVGNVLPAPRGNYVAIGGPARGRSQALLVDLGSGAGAQGAFLRTGEDTVFSADGSTAAWAEYEGNVREATIAWATLAGERPRRIETHLTFFRVTRLVLSPDGKQLAVLHGDSTLSVVALTTEKARLEVKLPAEQVRAVSFLSPERLRLWLATGEIDEVDLAAGKLIQVGSLAAAGLFEQRPAGAHSWSMRQWWSARPSPDGSRVIALDYSRDAGPRLRLLDGETGAVLWEKSAGRPQRPLTARFRSDGRVLVGEERDGELHLTILAPSGAEEKTFPLGTSDHINLGAEIVPGHLAVELREAGGDPGQLLVIDLGSGEILHRSEGLTPPRSLFWTSTVPEPGSLATRLFFDREQALYLLDPATYERRRVLPIR